MTYYPTTTLPSSPPYATLDQIMDSLCDQCLKIQYFEHLSESDKQQAFDLTMSLLAFWDHELAEWSSK
tara:strand:- start:729 stop:932 length:204 start_codon:yes stop_codon:yes gene_type:complete